MAEPVTTSAGAAVAAGGTKVVVTTSGGVGAPAGTSAVGAPSVGTGAAGASAGNGALAAKMPAMAGGEIASATTPTAATPTTTAMASASPLPADPGAGAPSQPGVFAKVDGEWTRVSNDPDSLNAKSTLINFSGDEIIGMAEGSSHPSMIDRATSGPQSQPLDRARAGPEASGPSGPQPFDRAQAEAPETPSPEPEPIDDQNTPAELGRRWNEEVQQGRARVQDAVDRATQPVFDTVVGTNPNPGQLFHGAQIAVAHAAATVILDEAQGILELPGSILQLGSKTGTQGAKGLVHDLGTVADALSNLVPGARAAKGAAKKGFSKAKRSISGAPSRPKPSASPGSPTGKPKAKTKTKQSSSSRVGNSQKRRARRAPDPYEAPVRDRQPGDPKLSPAKMRSVQQARDAYYQASRDARRRRRSPRVRGIEADKDALDISQAQEGGRVVGERQTGISDKPGKGKRLDYTDTRAKTDIEFKTTIVDENNMIVEKFNPSQMQSQELHAKLKADEGWTLHRIDSNGQIYTYSVPKGFDFDNPSSPQPTWVRESF